MRPHDNTTLFCPAGMQQFKDDYRGNRHGTVSNIQSCIRLNDLDEIGDQTHHLTFDMIGLFSFRDMSVLESIDFWFEFLSRIGIKPDVVTIHPDKMLDWRELYRGRDVEIRPDPECTWSDGELGGYCTEFYVRGVEIGNIVNTNGDSIDVGFGMERLLWVLGEETPPRGDILVRTIDRIVESGYRPSGKQQGHVLRRLIGMLTDEGSHPNHPEVVSETSRRVKLSERFDRLWPKHKDKSPEWWLDTHGIVVNEMVLRV